MWCQDEARVGRKGRGTRVWYERGARPDGILDRRHASAWPYGAIRPGAGDAFAPVLTETGAAATRVFLDRFAAGPAPGAHAALPPDQAGWRTAKAIAAPANVSLIHLPPHSPEANPVGRIWLCLRERLLSHRLLEGPGAVLDGRSDARNRLVAEPGRIASLTDYAYLRSVRTS